MFLYHINHSFANQSILAHADGGLQLGDCVYDESKENYYLVLGETIHREHLYKIGQAPALLTPSPLGRGVGGEGVLLSTPTLSLIHHLTHEYYTSYANILKLYLPKDIAKLISRQPSIKKSIPASSLTSPKGFQEGQGAIGVNPKGGGFKQHIIIMPDWRTIVNLQDKYGYTMDQALGSQHTSLQDIRQFWKMKHGQSELLICTPSECFWDYHDLSQITLIDPHKRYYKSQQDPRYDIMRVCELMAHYYDCELVTNT